MNLVLLSDTVHPHTHGELLENGCYSVYRGGSSPYTRGTRILRLSVLLRLRFIPIHTGNSDYVLWDCFYYMVHPHTHGELAGVVFIGCPLGGSSPYTRGTQEMYRTKSIGLRFIPIHTGNSLVEDVRAFAEAVHPHTHGELCNPMIIIHYLSGSSPYTRGTRGYNRVICSHIRFIPIHTGNS